MFQSLSHKYHPFHFGKPHPLQVDINITPMIPISKNTYAYFVVLCCVLFCLFVLRYTCTNTHTTAHSNDCPLLVVFAKDLGPFQFLCSCVCLVCLVCLVCVCLSCLFVCFVLFCFVLFCLFVCLSVCLCVCLFVCLYVCLFVCLFVLLCGVLFVCKFVTSVGQ